MKRSRGDDDDDDDEPFIFHHVKRTRIGNVLETSENEEEEITKCVQHKDWGVEEPSNLYVEVWEEVKDEYLARTFHKHHRTREEKRALQVPKVGARERYREIEVEDDPKDLVIEWTQP